MGSSGSGDAMGGLQTVAGAGLLAMGNPAGAPLLMNGVGQLSSQGGQQQGQQQGAMGSPLSSLGPLAQMFMGQSKPQTPMPPPMAMGHGGGAPPPMQVPQVPAPPPVPQSGGSGPLMVLLQKLAGGLG